MSAQNPPGPRRRIRKKGFSPAVTDKIRGSILLMRVATAVVGAVAGILMMMFFYEFRLFDSRDATVSFVSYSLVFLFLGAFIMMFVLIRSAETNLQLTEEMHVKISREMIGIAEQIQTKVEYKTSTARPFGEGPPDEHAAPSADVDPLDLF